MSGAADRPAALTGGTGFPGRYVALALERAGWRLRLLVRSEPVHPQTAALAPEIVFGDLGDEAALGRLCRGADLVVHAAGLVPLRHWLRRAYCCPPRWRTSLASWSA